VPYDLPDDEAIARARVKPHVPAPVEVVVPDPSWPAAFDQVRQRISNALGQWRWRSNTSARRRCRGCG
jgi:hypothetical protein